ncbi:hypothetical protein ACSBR2_001353 [Camellia fascicularis]
MAERIHDRPLTRPIEVMLDIKQDYGLDITYRVTWLRVEKARGELFGAHSISFDHLRWYISAVIEHNPGSYINDHTHWFTRYFISFKGCIDGFIHCRPLLFLDATFLKGRFKGFLLAATTKDGNQGEDDTARCAQMLQNHSTHGSESLAIFQSPGWLATLERK